MAPAWTKLLHCSSWSSTVSSTVNHIVVHRLWSYGTPSNYVMSRLECGQQGILWRPDTIALSICCTALTANFDITFCTVPLQHFFGDSVTIILTFIIIIIIIIMRARMKRHGFTPNSSNTTVTFRLQRRRENQNVSQSTDGDDVYAASERRPYRTASSRFCRGRCSDAGLGLVPGSIDQLNWMVRCHGLLLPDRYIGRNWYVLGMHTAFYSLPYFARQCSRFVVR